MIAQRPWVTIDASRQGEVRLALVHPGERPRADTTRTYDATALPTFTDALMRFQADAAVDLNTMDAVLALAGAVTTGSAIPISRSRWTVSRTGLAALFRGPPIILNDVAARAWALRSAAAPPRILRGAGMPDLTRAGRYVLIMVEEGVGCAKIDIDDSGAMRVLESEVGHVDFSPCTAAEHRLADLLARDGMPGSWEQALMIDRSDPRLTQATPGMSDADRARMLAAMMGRFTVNTLLSAAAWNGAMLTGRGASRIIASDPDAFDGSFHHRRSFRRLIANIPCWQIDQPDPVLVGLAALVADRDRPGVPG